MPRTGQSEEARHSIARAIAQPIPASGDGRRGGYDDYKNVQKESVTLRSMLAEDGLWEWRPPPEQLPPQAAPGASMDQLLAAVPAGGVAWLTFGNAGVAEMLMNWVAHALRLGLGRALVVAAYDAELLRLLRERRIPCYNYTGGLPEHHFRGTPFLFHRMGFLKVS
jgi:hypothetical protein